MGWQDDNQPGHEGYLVGLVRAEGPLATDWCSVEGVGLRRLASRADDQDRADIAAVQVGCDCGWRSARLVPPLGTSWAPFTVQLPRDAHGRAFETAARAAWRRHLVDAEVL